MGLSTLTSVMLETVKGMLPTTGEETELAEGMESGALVSLMMWCRMFRIGCHLVRLCSEPSPEWSAYKNGTQYGHSRVSTSHDLWWIVIRMVLL